jgi:hypothetical protein
MLIVPQLKYMQFTKWCSSDTVKRSCTYLLELLSYHYGLRIYVDPYSLFGRSHFTLLSTTSVNLKWFKISAFSIIGYINFISSKSETQKKWGFILRIRFIGLAKYSVNKDSPLTLLQLLDFDQCDEKPDLMHLHWHKYLKLMCSNTFSD